MTEPLPIPELLDEWIHWAQWMSTEDRDQSKASDFLGFSEFEWVIREHPEHGWNAILAVLNDPRAKPYIGMLAAGPIEDLLGHHGIQFIDRVELEARSNPAFAWALGGVWQCQMTDEIWARVQQVWNRRGWDGIPA
jgi:hypothetical protein